MQTQNIKAVRTKDDRLFIFYYSGNAVFCRQIQKGLNAPPIKIIENVYPMFSLWCSDSGIYLLCKGSGGVTLCFYNYSRWASKLISQDADTSYSKMSFFTIGEAVHILYSVKSGDEGLETLYVRSMNKENWALPLKIADIMPFGSTAYFVGRESPENIKIYYRLSDKTIKYRSLDLRSGGLTESENLLATNLPCSDISILTRGSESHILYLAQGMFSSQLIYKGIRAGVQSKARVIWEGQLSGSCALFYCDSRLYALIYNETKSYAMYSDESGRAFSLAKNLGVKINSSCSKAEYLDFYRNSGFAADEVILDTSDSTFPVVPDLHPSFIPSGIAADEPVPVQDKPVRDTSLKAAEYEEQLVTMTDQIGELSQTLARRNEEIAAVSARWRAKYEALSKENELLKARIAAAEEAKAPSASVNTVQEQAEQPSEDA